MNREISGSVKEQTNKENQCKKGLTSFVFTPQTTLSFVPSLFKKFSCNQKPLAILLSSLLCGTLALSGCSNNDSSGSSDTLNVDITSNVPANVVAGNQAILDAEVNVNGGQAANAALFTLGADASDALATITAINYPSVSGVDFTQIIPNGTELPDCSVGLSLSNASPSCMLKVSIEGQAGQTIDNDIEVVTDVQTLDIAIQTSFVNTGSTALPQGQVSNQVTVAPDSTVQVTVSNAQSNTESFNNLHLTIPSWLAEIATNLVGGTVSTDEESDTTTITYTVNGANVNLAPGQTHTFSFDLGGDDVTFLALLAYYDELIDNSTSEIIVVNASNLRNPITPDLTVSLTPASMTDEVTLSDPNEPQTITLQNLSNSQLRITNIDESNLPTGVSIVEGEGTTCSTEVDINPTEDAGDSCTIELAVAVDAIPEVNKTLSIDYMDPQNNTFEDSTEVNIGGAEIIINGFNSIELPVSGNKTTNVTITNTGALNWLPSTQAVNYEITEGNESESAANISVIVPTAGTNCLDGTVVMPSGSCNIGIQTTAGNEDPDDDTEIGNYVLSVLPANNLETTYTTNFSVIEPTEGSFSFLNEEGQTITTQNYEIGDSPIILTLTNEGSLEITGVYLTIPDKFTTAAPDMGVTACPESADTTISLANGETCSLKVSVDDDEGTGGSNPQDYDIIATGDEATVDNNGQTLTAMVQGAVVTLPDEVSIPKPAGEDPTEVVVTITNNGTNTIAWQPSADLNDYTITGDDTTGISVVSTAVENSCETIGEVAIDASCTIAIQVADTATEDTYTLTLNLINNLAAVQNQDFNVTGTLGYFSFNQNGEIIEGITIGTDSTSQPQEITLTNYGETTITNVYLDLSNIPGFTLPTNNCGTNETKLAELDSGANCTFEIAANNSFNSENSPVTISAFGDDATVENNEAEFDVTVNGVTVQIQDFNENNTFRRPAADTYTENIEINNLSQITVWVPSSNTADYQIVTSNDNMSVVAPTGEVDNCLTVASVPVEGSCYIGVQVNSATPTENYTIQALASTENPNNLPQASNSLSFTVSDSLGYFEYSGDGISNNELTLTIGADPVTVTLTNSGDTEIIDLQGPGADEDKFDITDPDNEAPYCLDTDSLAADESCQFNLALSDLAETDTTYEFVVTADNASNSPAELMVTTEEANPLACDTGTIEVGNYEWAPDANLGVAANAAAIAGVNADGTMSWDTATGDFINWLNSENYCGHNDWEIPSLAQYGCSVAFGTCDQLVVNGLLSSGWNGTESPVDYLTGLSFTNVKSLDYWSGIEFFGGGVWFLDMDDGNVDVFGKGSDGYVLPVRTPPRFVAYNGTSCIQDTQTGLVWYYDGNSYADTWTNLNNQFPQDGSSSDELCGQTGWRMPSADELASNGLLRGWNDAGACGGNDCSSAQGFLQSNDWVDIDNPGYYWTSTRGPSGPLQPEIALVVLMSSGTTGSQPITGSRPLLPVRSAW